MPAYVFCVLKIYGVDLCCGLLVVLVVACFACGVLCGLFCVLLVTEVDLVCY